MNGRVGGTCGLILCQKHHKMITCNLHVSHRSVGCTIVLNWTADILVQESFLKPRQPGNDYHSFDIVIPPPTAQRVLDICCLEDWNACTTYCTSI